eukprot:412296-Pyramimonas_sp.AAC.1
MPREPEEQGQADWRFLGDGGSPGQRGAQLHRFRGEDGAEARIRGARPPGGGRREVGQTRMGSSGHGLRLQHDGHGDLRE